MTEIRIESTNYCGYKCVFCPREKMTREQGVMSVDDFILVLRRIKELYGDYSEQIHLHGYGESLLDKGLPEKSLLLERLSQIQNCISYRPSA
jgi:molybdenum cofactor biosynthesis enzyme MoaA